MEIGKTYKTTLEVKGVPYSLEVEPFMIKDALKFNVKCNGAGTQFGYSATLGRLKAANPMYDELEIAIADWIDGQYA